MKRQTQVGWQNSGSMCYLNRTTHRDMAKSYKLVVGRQQITNINYAKMGKNLAL